MKVSVFNSKSSETSNPVANSIIIRITSNYDFATMKYRDAYQDVLELRFDDISDSHPKEDSMLYGAMTQNQYTQIKGFISKNMNAKELHVHCDAGQSRSPAIALAVLDYLLLDHEQAQELLQKNRHWKPNSHVSSFFTRDYWHSNAND